VRAGRSPHERAWTQTTGSLDFYSLPLLSTGDYLPLFLSPDSHPPTSTPPPLPYCTQHRPLSPLTPPTRHRPRLAWVSWSGSWRTRGRRSPAARRASPPSRRRRAGRALPSQPPRRAHACKHTCVRPAAATRRNRRPCPRARRGWHRRWLRSGLRTCGAAGQLPHDCCDTLAGAQLHPHRRDTITRRS